MAESAVEPFEFPLPLDVKVIPDGRLPKGGLKELSQVLRESLPSLRTHVENRNLKYVHITDVVYIDQTVNVKFKLTSEEELVSFKAAADQGTLSDGFTNFAEKQLLHVAARVPEKRLRLNLELKAPLYNRAETSLRKKADDRGAKTHKPSTKKPNDHEGEIPDLLTGTDLVFADEGSRKDASEQASYAGTVQTSQPDDALAVVQTQHQQPWNERGDNNAVPNISNTFYLYLPSTKYRNILSVQFRSRTKDKRMNAVYNCDGLWETTVSFPPSDIDNFDTYCYDAEVENIRLFRNRKSCLKVEFNRSLNFNIQRDIMKGMDAIGGVDKHIVHLFSLLDCNNLKDSVVQLEHLLCRHPFHNAYVKSLNDLVINVMQTGSDVSRLLLAVMIGQVLAYNYAPTLSLCLSRSQAKDLLKSLQCSATSALPSSCSNYMPNACEQFFKIVYGNEFSLLKYILSIFPYLDEAYFCNDFNFPRYIANEHSADELVQDVCAIFSVIEEKFNDQPSALCKVLLETITSRLPLEVSTRALTHWKGTQKEEPELMKCVIESITVVVQRKIIDSRKKKDYSAMLYIWNICNLCNEIQKLVEDGFLNMAEQTKSLAKDDLSVVKFIVSVKCELFNTTERQLELLQKFAESDNEELHVMFVEMLKLQPACHTVVDNKLICTWYQTALHKFSGDRQDNVVHALSYFTDVCSVEACKMLAEDELLKIALKWFERINLKDILQQAKAVEKELNNRQLIWKTYTDIVSRIIKQKHGEKPYKMINSLCTRGELTVTSSMTASLVCAILDQQKFSSTDNLCAFRSMLCNLEFWKSVLKVNGTESHIVKQNEVFIEGSTCLHTMLKSLSNLDVPCAYVRRLQQDSMMPEAKQLLDTVPGTDFVEITQLLTEAESIFNEEKEKVENVLSILKEVKIGLKHENKLPMGFSNIINILEGMKSRLQQGTLTPRYLKTEHIFWGDLADLPRLCEFLKGSVFSKVFWNVSLDNVLEEFQHTITDQNVNDKNDEILEDICNLFGETRSTDTNHEQCPDTRIFLKVLSETGGKLYRNAWQSIQNYDDKQIVDVIEMIRGADIVQEVQFATNFLKSEIYEDVIDALYRLSTIHEIEYKVNAMKSALEAFCIDPKDDENFNSAVTSFENLLSNDIRSSTFVGVSGNLQVVFLVTEKLSPETIDILASLGQSSTLIQFLSEIVDDDIRNLIDAVEDISEQHVRESTVSGLIEVKRFLQPLLKVENSLNAEILFSKVSVQTSSLANASSLATKIEDCMDNLHNLKSLYNNVANRGEQTKEIIDHIVKKGKIIFQLENGQVCDFKAKYKQDKKDVIHTNTTLIDLRSRALLLMNTDAKETERRIKGEDLMKFVGFVDVCMEISELIQKLYVSGHTAYKTFARKVDPSNLCQLENCLKSDLIDWNNILSSVRDTHYLLNFIKGTQIHMLHEYLETGKEKERARTLLKFIHPALEIEGLQDFYSSQKEHTVSWSNQTMLNYIGEMLHTACEQLKFFNRPLYMQTNKQGRLVEVVQKGKLFVTTLAENSQLVVKILLALYGNTMQKLPEPNQVLFCTKETSWEEVSLIIQRCLGAQEYYTQPELFCIANVELLSNELQFRLVDCLRNLDKYKKFLLAIICRGSSKHPFLDELSDCAQVVRPITDAHMMKIFQFECPNVCTYTSEVAGLGKTNTIHINAHITGKAVKNLHISGPVHKEQLVERLRTLNVKDCHMLHVDIGNVDSPLELDMFLFELVLLRFVTAGTVSVNLPTMYISLEISNTMNNILRNALQTAMAFQREHLVWKSYKDFIVCQEINSPVQVVCHFLQCLQNGNLDKLDIFFNGSDAVKALSPAICRQLLHKYFSIGSEMSFSIVNIFLNVLADQLKKMSCSTFFRTSMIVDMMGNKNKPTVRSSLVQALVEVSREFSTRSVNACRSTQESTIKTANKLSDAQRALSEYTTEGIDSMIRWEESNHLIYVFHNQNIQTISPMYREIGKVPSHIKILFESQMKRSMNDFKEMDQSQLQSMLQKVARTDPVPVLDSKLGVLAQYYALTPDNLLKMVLIMMRIKANIPVIVMGETGCGKTSLVRYLADICEVPFEILSIHAGVEENAILEKVGEVNSKALTDTTSEYWLFLDEINTSEHLGLMSNIICHKRCFDKTLAPNLVVMAACNPYKLRTYSAISSAGLQGKVKADELSRLVYRVLPLPEMMVDYVWDFGSLSENDEIAYIRRMTECVFPDETNCHALLTDVLCASQKFVRENEQIASSVSLRDVQRCRILTEWFLDILPRKTLKCPGKSHCPIDLKHRAIILALAHCYHSRFPKNDVRREYRKTVAKAFEFHSVQVVSDEVIKYVIQEEQKDILFRMELPEGTAQNTALHENVFVILICILNRIPIFLIGKPGCSKSLSMQVIRSNLRGKDSKDEFFKTLPQLYCVSYQGSESSTSDGIIRVFDKAEKYQRSNMADEVLSVVILDEIGLAEISRFNPLKVLHNLLEPDGQPRPNVAVVGISNWALDASKMNRAVHLSRPEMDVAELFETGVSISDSFVRSTGDRFHLLTQKQNRLSPLQIRDDLHQIAESYVNYIQQLRFKNFHGLRDYYSLVKFISRILATDPEAADSVASKSNIFIHGLQRNFGGLPSELVTLMEIFQINQYKTKHEHIPVMHLIKDNVTDKMARHLMLITSGDGVMGILETELNSIGRQDKVIIFGSQFEEDLTDDYNYRILSRIILCMEEGLVLVLKDLESIYGSLYDMLNQNYTVIGKKKNCRVALGHYSNPVCHVNDTFRCVVLVDECQLDHSDPPFLNRFEKQYLKFSDTITRSEQNIIEELNCWINEITDILEREFTAYDIFPIYSEDMVASLVMKMSHCDDENVKPTKTEIVRKCIEELMWIMKPEAIVRVTKAENTSMSTDSDRLKKRYFDLPLHNGICGLIAHQMDKGRERDNEIQNGHMTMVFTNSNIHSKVLNSATNMTFQIEKLGSFKSEKQLSTRLQHFWIESNTEVLFLQCSAIDDEKHIMLSKSIIEHLRLDAIKTRSDVRKHVYIVVHLDKSKGNSKTVAQLNFLSDWKLVMLDSIETPMMTLPELCSYKLLETVEKKRPLQGYIQEQLTWAFTRIKYTAEGRDVSSILQVLENLEECPDFLITLDEVMFYHINTTILEEDENEDWQVKVACDIHALNTSSCFVDALEQHVLDVINVPLSKAVFQLECASAIDSFLLTDSSSTDRRKVWKRMLGNKDVYSIDAIPAETGPECYTCSCENLQLRMPFSRYIFSKIETTKEEFMEYVTYLKGKCDLDADDDLPDGLWKELLLKQDSLILQEVSHMTDLVYTGWIDDYIHDFCNIVSFSASLNLNEDDRIYIMRWALEQKTTLTISDPTDLFVALHTTFWVNAALFCADVQLLATCTEVLGTGYKVEQILQAACISDDDSESSLLKATETSGAEMETEQFSTQHGTTNTESKVSNIYQQNYSDSEESRNTKESMDGVCEKPTDVCLNPDMEAKSNVSNTIESQADICTEVMSGDTDELNENKDNIHSETASQPKDYAEPDKYSPTRRMTDFNDFDANSDDTDIFGPHDRLVELICQKMLPTDKTLAMFANTEIWQRRVTSILTIAGQVSVEPNNLHALRFCSDIAASLVIPHTLDKQFGKLGKALQDNCSLDSKTVFDSVMHIVSCCPSQAQHECQRTLCQYFIRCFSSDPDANSCKFLLEAILQSKLPDGQLQLVKGPFYDALQNELQDNETVFDDMMTTESNTSTDGVKNGIPEGDNSDTDDSYGAPKLSPLLCDIDGCLKTLADSEKADSPFSLLLVDILEDIYSAGIERGFTTKESIIETNNRLLASHQILRGHSFGLKYVSAIAYFKSCVTVLVTLLDKHQCDQSKFALPFQTLNVILNPDSKLSDICGLQIFILKLLGSETPACHVKRRFEQVKHQVPFLGDIATCICSESQVKICFDGSPLCIHVPSYVCHLLEFTKHKEEQQTQCIENLVEAASDDVSEFLVMHAIAVTHYYLPRSHTDIIDTMQPVATKLVESAKKNMLEHQNIALLERLLGHVDFSVPSLNLSQESSSNETTTFSYLVVLYSLLLGQANYTSVFVKVLRNASEAKNFFLPGNPDEDRTRAAHYCNSATIYINCKCGHRLAVQKYHGLETNIQCVVCGGECKVKEMSDKNCACVSTNMDTKVHYKHGYHIVIDTDEDFTVRDMSPMAYCILNIITCGTLLGSMALGFSSSKDMEAVTGISEVDGIDMNLLKQIEHHWQMLEVMLNIGHYNVGIFLHAVLFHTRELLCEKATSMSDPKNRLSWEKTFTQHVHELAGKRFDYMYGLVCKHENLHELDVSEMIENIHEMNDIAAISMAERNIQLPSLFRLKGQPTTVSFRTELSMRNGNEFPFLKLVLEMTPKLKLLASLLPILRWHLSTVAHASYIMKKHECLDMTVSDFLHHNENEKEKQVIKKNFDAFQRAWNNLDDLLDNKSSKALRVKQINRSSKVAECLILDEGSPVFVVLHELVGVQNTFLDNTLAFASCCKATSFLSREKNVSVIRCIPITEATNQTIIQFYWSDDVLNKSQCDLSYNKGRHVKYDFENIERQLGATILVNKAYLLLKNSLPMITFSDKLYRNFVSMVNELKEIVPQKPLPQEVVTGIKKKKESSPKLITNLLTNLGVILSLVKKTRGKPDMPLVDYADQWKNMLTRQFPKDTLPSPETSVKLCHLVALHELLEEHNADSVIDSLEKAFRTPLTDDLEQHFTQFVNAHIHVAHNLLRAVKIFAHRCLSLRDADPALSIHEYLSEVSFWPDGSLSGHDVCGADIPMVQLLPDRLLVQHVYAMVTLIEGKIEEAQEQEMKLESMHTSWRKQVTVTQPALKTKKRAARRRCDY